MSMLNVQGRTPVALFAVAFLGGRTLPGCLANYESILSGCPLRTPPGMWPAAAAYEGAETTAQGVLPGVTAGSFAQSAVRLTGLCSPDSFLSNAFQADDSAGAWTAHLVQHTDVQLESGLDRCQLQAVSVVREDSPQGRVTLRLQFTQCNGNGKSAGVEVELKESVECASNLLPWMCRLSGKAQPTACLEGATRAAPLTTRSPGEVSLTLRARWREVGSGRCTGAGLQEEPLADPQSGGPTERAQCRDACVASLAKFQLASAGGAIQQERCRGFAYNPQAIASRCILYRSATLDITGSEGSSAVPNPGSWSCWAFDVLRGSFDHHAPGSAERAAGIPEPPQAEHEERLLLFAPAGVRGLDSAPTSAVLRRLTPPTEVPSCYSPVDWFSLESSPGTEATVCVREGDLARIREMVPPKPTGCCSRAPGELIVDRVCIISCGSDRGDCLGRAPSSILPTRSWVQNLGTGCSSCWFSRLLAGLLGALLGVLLTALLFFCYFRNAWKRNDPQEKFRLVMHEYDSYGRGQMVDSQTWAFDVEPQHKVDSQTWAFDLEPHRKS